MKILSFLTDKNTEAPRGEGRVTEVKGKYHRLSHQNGLIELSFNLAPDQRAAFDAQSAALQSALHNAISTSTDTLNAKVAEAKREAEAAVTEARAKYDADLFALFSEFGRIPSREALITNDTPVGHVVRLPESAIVPPKAVTA
jgi:NAD-specific glutamate dehydrogenase